ncbi:MAG: hypothetical protein UT11_C0067G0008 [Berkelbacteria bacterium GW2011_GWA2_38_9]|uniref:Uncharacterized protein n=1 Tax=Berkelbacteria bacterium GW2011_GWA2_38_9 TaxID=1618334 RepID=A0A0G0PBB0_9BACT|nr:MAG: hypothetical protein UT11_C0067G0008 [Berkelbacteria bacterium GW2011_GWA2_38_9]
MSIKSITIKSLYQNFYQDGFFKFEPDKPTFCIHINSLVNLGLSELGQTKKARDNMTNILKSPLYNSKLHLFYREINDKGQVTNNKINTCKNAVAALALYSVGIVNRANDVIDALFASPLFDKKSGLFFREYNSETNQVNHLIITQTNLWLVIVLVKLGQIDQAKRIMNSLEQIAFNRDYQLFNSEDCNYDEKKAHYNSLFSDDQALAIIAYKLLNRDDKAQKLARDLIESDLYDHQTGLFNRDITSGKVNDVKTSYKNALAGIALGLTEYQLELKMLQRSLTVNLYDMKSKLFNSSDKDQTKIPDNSMLALSALCKHIDIK